MQQQQQQQQQHYRAAVCLNNYGASLVERGCYRQAAIVLRDSLSIMNSIVVSQEQSVHDRDEHQFLSQAEVNQKLHFATKSLVDSQTSFPSKKRSAPFSKKSSSQQQPNFTTFRYNGVNSSLPSTSNKNNVVIVIDNFDDQASSSPNDMDIYTAIVVYNTAMARLAVAQTMPTSSSSLLFKQQRIKNIGNNHNNNAQQRLRQGCVKLFRYAHAMLSKEPDHDEAACCLRVLVLAQLVAILPSSDNNNDACSATAALQSAYQHLCARVAATDGGSMTRKGPSVAAAA